MKSSPRLPIFINFHIKVLFEKTFLCVHLTVISIPFLFNTDGHSSSSFIVFFFLESGVLSNIKEMKKSLSLLIFMSITCTLLARNLPLNTDGIWSSMSTSYSRIRMQNQDDTNAKPMVGSEWVRHLINNPHLGTERPEPVSIFIKPWKNWKKVNFPDEIKM